MNSYIKRGWRTHILFILLYVVLFFIQFFNPIYPPLFICLLVALFIALFINYHITISDEDNLIIYKLTLFTLQLYEKKIQYPSIRAIHFKCVNLGDKAATIKYSKRSSLSISAFKPDTIYETLERLCAEQEIQTIRSKEYNMICSYKNISKQ